MFPVLLHRKMPEKNEEPDSTPGHPLGGLLADRPVGGHSEPEPSAPLSQPLLAVIGNRSPDPPASQRSPGRLGQILVSFWRSLACHSQGPVQHPRGPLMTGLRLGTSYFQVSKKEVA